MNNGFMLGKRHISHTILALLIGLTMPAAARHQATVIMKSGGRAEGIVRYMPASRSYEITTPGARVTREVRADEVTRVVLAQQPPQLAQALSAVNSGNYQAAIPVLTKIIEDYAMFGPDVQAAQALTVAYLRTNRSRDALAAAEGLMRTNPEAGRTGAFASVYWEALMAENRIATLRTHIADAVAAGDRDLVAVALLRRGDLEMKEARPREALLDGYLRVVLLFQDIGFVQPEALYKAAKAHEALNEVQHAERWRQRLLRNFATSAYAAQLKQ